MMKRVIVRGMVFVWDKVLYSPSLEMFNGVAAEIDMSGERPVAWVNGEAFELSVQA